MKSGELKKRVQVQALPASQAMDPKWNEPTYGDWATQATVWAGVEPLSGRELVYAGQVAADATHQVKVRFYKGLTPRMRFLYVDDVTGVSRLFNIVFVKDLNERHKEMQCFCQESPPGA